MTLHFIYVETGRDRENTLIWRPVYCFGINRSEDII